MMKKNIASGLLALTLGLSTVAPSPPARGIAGIATLPFVPVVGGILITLGAYFGLQTGFALGRLAQDGRLSGSPDSQAFLGGLLAFGALLLPADGGVEFLPLLGHQGMDLSSDEVEDYNDLVPGLNSKARSIHHEILRAQEQGMIGSEELTELSAYLWADAFVELELNESQKSVVREVLSAPGRGEAI